jgi:hypothetical protein
MLVNSVDQNAVWASGTIAIAGVVVGAVLNYFLSDRSQRKQWQADNRKAEFRELITAVNESFTTILALSRNTPFFHDDQHQTDLTLAETNAVRVIADRIFIAHDVGKLKVMERWTAAARQFAHGKDIQAFGNEVNQLSEDIRRLALKSIDRRST